MWIALNLLLLVVCIALWIFFSRRTRILVHEKDVLREELTATERKHSADLIQIRTHQFAIFNSMVEGILILDERGRIVTVNDSLKRLFNITADVVGLTPIEALRSHELLDLVEQVRQTGLVRGFELSLPEIRQRRWLEVNAAAIREEGQEARAIILIFHDFTRIKQLENVRQEFVANVSHELRTPLTLIKGYVETLLDGAKDDPANTARFLQIIERHTERLTFLIEDLLTLSHLECGEALMHPQDLSLRDAVQRVLDELTETALQHQAMLVNAVSAECTAFADGDRLQQVLSNLVENAIKYGPGDNVVTVSAVETDGWLDVCVRDQGPGIPKEARERVFERFFRLDAARSRQAGGTGLGLAIVKHIVQRHGGRVWVESEGRGSTFHFTLPHSEKSNRLGLPFTAV